jgi:hypothetical protein
VSVEKERAYRDRLQPGAIQLLDGVGVWLEEFRRLGVRQVIGSSAPMANIVAMIHVLGIGDDFHAMLSGYRLPRGKPDPLLFLRCAAAAEADPQGCLVSIAVGKLATAAELEPYRQVAWPPCLASASLADVTPTQVHSLFSGGGVPERP